MIAIAKQRYWSRDEDKAVVDMLSAGVSIREIAERLDRSEKAVRNRCVRVDIDVCAVRRKNKPEAFDAADVRCPFFCTFRKGRSIKCEGITDKSYVHLSFNDEQAWMEQVRSRCNKDYRSCSLYGMLYGVYLPH